MEPFENCEAHETLTRLARTGDSSALDAFVLTLSVGDIARALSLMTEDDRASVIGGLDPERAAFILEAISETQAGNILHELPAEDAIAIVDALASDEQADLLAELDPEEAEAILQEIDPGHAEEARELLSYPTDSAGGLMHKEYVALDERLTVGEVIKDLRENQRTYREFRVQYLFSISPDNELAGVLPVRELIFADPNVTIRSVATRRPIRVTATTTLEDLEATFGKHPFLGLPVVNKQEQLIGVVSQTAVEEAVGHRSEDTLLKVSGIVGGDELRSMPIRLRAFRRLSWLSLNIVLNLIAASVIAFYEETIQQVIALAVFLPIISDMSGCSGNQAVTVSIRELTLGVARPGDTLRVIGKEAAVGVINGMFLGCLLAVIAYLWRGDLWLGAVIGGALAMNTVVSVTLGGALPLILKRFGRDPALAAAPILTTVTDLFGFFLTLALATAALARLSS